MNPYCHCRRFTFRQAPRKSSQLVDVMASYHKHTQNRSILITTPSSQEKYFNGSAAEILLSILSQILAAGQKQIRPPGMLRTKMKSRQNTKARQCQRRAKKNNGTIARRKLSHCIVRPHNCRLSERFRLPVRRQCRHRCSRMKCAVSTTPRTPT